MFQKHQLLKITLSFTGVVALLLVLMISIGVAAPLLFQEPDIYVDPLSITSTQETNTIANHPLTIENVGAADLEWFIDEDDLSPAQNRPFAAGGHPALEATDPKAAPVDGPVTPARLGSNAYSWNGQPQEPYYTVFDIDTPGVLPNIAPFPNIFYMVAGEYVNGLVYMIDESYLMYELDPPTGAILNQYLATEPPGNGTYSGMAVDPTTGIVYASSTNITTSWLAAIHPATGLATLIGPITGSPANVAISFDAAGNLYGFDMATDSMIAIDKSTGAGTDLGPLPFDQSYEGGMGYDPATDTLYLAAFNAGTSRAELWTYDPATNGYAFLGVLGEDVPGGLNVMSWLAFENGPMPAVCELPSNVPWLSVAPDTGVTAPGITDTVEVTFDATGIVAGMYDASLCVRSNDPDPGPGNGTELVIVDLQMIVEQPTDVGLSVLSGQSGRTSAAILPALIAILGALAAGCALLRRRRLMPTENPTVRRSP